MRFQSSMVGRFRISDFGLQNCTAGIWLPTQALLDANNASYTLTGNDSTVNVWELDHPGTLKNQLGGICSSSRELLGTIDLRPGSATYLPGFPCSSGSTLTLEFQCASPSCDLKLTQKRSKKLHMGMSFTVTTTVHSLTIFTGLYLFQRSGWL
jgi:hypothetical protein